MSVFEKFADMSTKGNKPLIINLTTTDLVYRMKVSDTCVIAYASCGGDGNGIIYLPPVAEAAGQFYYINAPTGATGDDISLYILETQAELTTNGDMDADDDYIVLYSDGRQWRTVLDGVA